MADVGSDPRGVKPSWRGALGGAAAGVALVALVAVGWMLGARRAAPGEGVSPPPAADPPAVSGESPHGEAARPESAVVARLRGDLAAEPGRLDLRRRLALELLRAGDFLGAFEESERLLAAAPDDQDGLFVQGAVRVRMGQPSRALPLLDRVLAQAPEHVPALTAKGQALAKAGHREQAADVWRRALELAGGSHPQIEGLLREAAAGSPDPR